MIVCKNAEKNQYGQFMEFEYLTYVPIDLDALDVTMAQRAELDYLIYNDPLAYAELILNGEPEEYLKNVAGSHGLED